MDSLLLRRILKNALRVSLASPLALAGCPGDEIDTAGFDSPECVGSVLAVRGLTPGVVPDVIQLRSWSTFGPQDVDRDDVVLSSEGTACATAADVAACQAALDALAPPAGFRRDCVDLCSQYYLATTRRDAVEAHASVEALTAFLATIDTTQEAVLLAFAHGYNFACDDPSQGGAKALEGGGYAVIGMKGHTCGEGTALTRHLVHVSADGQVTEQEQEVVEEGNPNCVVGRRPEGLELLCADAGAADALGRHFAVAAHFEEASVHAFLRLRRELEALGAPPELLREATLSALDEVFHADASARVARARGADVSPARVAPERARSAFDIALENRVEGCVRETYGALLAHHQAETAADPAVRRLMADIAEDETRHAALSWQVDAWLTERLGADERRRLDEAQREAIDSLRLEVQAPVAAPLRDEAGVPGPEEASRLVEALAGLLWGPPGHTPAA